MKISKLLTLFAAVLIAACNVDAQSIAVKAGLNLSSFKYTKGSEADETLNEGVSNNPGFQIGATIDYSLTDLIALQGGLLFETRGTKWRYDDPSGPEFYNSAQINTSYLVIPLHVKANFEAGEAIVHILMGPYASIGLSGKAKHDQKYTPGDPDIWEQEIDWKDGGDLRRGDFGFNFGAGVSIADFHFGLQYALGMANINGQSDLNKIKQNVLNFYLAYTVFNND